MSDKEFRESNPVMPVSRSLPVSVAVARAGAGELADADVIEPDQSDQATGANPLLVVHQLLRGRYLSAVALGLVLAAVGVYAGYHATVPTYLSTGLVRVRVLLPRIIFTTEHNSVMPAYEAFVNSQLALIQSERVLTRAMQTPVWKERGRAMSAEAFGNSLLVTYPKSTEYVSISFRSDDPEVARAAVGATIAAYLQIYEETDLDGKRQREALEERKLQLTAELERLESAVLSLSPFGPTAVEQNHGFKLSELNKLEAEMRRVEVQIASRDTGRAGSAEAARTSALTPDEVAPFDAEVKRLLEEKRNVEWELRRFELLGLGAQHSNVRQAADRLLFLDAGVEQRLKQLGPDFLSGLAAAGPTTQPVELPVASLSELRQRLRNTTALHDALRKEVADLSALGTQVQTLLRQAGHVRQSLETTKDRLEALDVESGIGGRLSILSEAERPSAPEKDRRKVVAAAAGGGGMAGGIGLVLVVGLLDRRFRYVADAECHWGKALPVLGVLPELAEREGSDPEAAPAAQSLHQIRASLQIHSRVSGSRVFAVTSPSPAAGKTSFAIALGVSFAASGSRTLLIDFDVVGEGLTRRMAGRVGGAAPPRRKLGRLLREMRVLDERQLTQALRNAARSRLRLGEAVVALGYASAADVDAALAAQGRAGAGLSDALEENSLSDCVTETGLPGLLLLPLGSGDGGHGRPGLSPAAAHRLLEQARQKFDVVLVDTGPVPGSVEASVVASQSDQVLLVLRRGEHRRSADRAVRHLRAAGARMAGLVFNRARGDDNEMYNRSGSGSRPTLSSRIRPADTMRPLESIAGRR